MFATWRPRERSKLLPHIQSPITTTTCTYLENLFRMRPLGVVSKNVIGDLKMANAIRSCNLRDAYKTPPRCISCDRSVSPTRLPATLIRSFQEKIWYGSRKKQMNSPRWNRRSTRSVSGRPPRPQPQYRRRSKFPDTCPLPGFSLAFRSSTCQIMY